MRRLAIASLSFSGAIFAACYWLPYRWLPALCGAALAAGALLRAPGRRWLRGFGLGLLACGAGLGWFWLHGQWTAVPASRLDGTTAAVSARLVDWPQSYESYTRVEVRLETEGLPRVNALLYDNARSLADAKPGDLVSLEARLRAADRRYGKADGTYNARDIYLILSSRGEISLTPEQTPLSLAPVALNRRLSDLVGALFPADTAPFFRALTLGDKAELYRDRPLHIALSRAGLMHITAVSGLHIVFLVSLLQTILGRGRRASVLGLVLVWGFVAVVGAPPSAVRAGLMQTLLLLAPLLRRENDAVTSLSAALGLILLFNPYAAAGVGLQLSFAALAGLLCFSGRLSEAVYRRLPALRASGPGRGAVGALVNSLSVMPFTLPLMGLHFGYISLLSPLSNLLCFWAVSLCFGGAFAAAALGLLYAPLGGGLARLLAWLARYVFLAARFVSGLPFSAVYLDRRETVAWFVLACALFLVFRRVRVRPALRVGIPAAVSAAALFAVLLAARLDYARGPATFAALDVGQGQCLCVLAGERTMMIDCGGLGTADNAGETAGAYLLSRGRRQVDVLLLTHLDSDHCNGVTTLLALCPVRHLLLPAASADGSAAFLDIQSAARQQGMELLLVSEDIALTLEELYAEVYAPPEGAAGNDACLSCVVSVGDFDMLVTGDLSQRAEGSLLERHPLAGLELYVAGHHGSKNASSERLLGSIGADTAIVSCGYNSYGHPAEETLGRLENYGYTVLRTDTGGTIELRIGNDYGEKKQSA